LSGVFAGVNLKPMSEPMALLVAATFLVAGFVKGAIGLGLPTVAMGLLGLALAPVEAAALVVIPSLATNLWQMAAGPRLGALWRRLWPMMLGICVGTWFGPSLPGDGDPGAATTALGIVLALYAAIGLTPMRLSLPVRPGRAVFALVGTATGCLTAATGVFVVPAVPYLQSLGLEPAELVQALGLSFTVSTVALAASLVHHGSFPPALLAASLLALIPAGAGMMLGRWVRQRASTETFRFWFLLGLLGLGCHLALRRFL
jgi:uncharacterized membrane protein YfcA